MTNLAASERETIILFDDETNTATLETCNKSWKNRMNANCIKNADCYLVSENEYSRKYKFPKKWVKVKIPRQLSEEQRQKMSDRARKNFHGEKGEKNDV